MKKEKILKAVSIILLVIYAIIFGIMMINKVMMKGEPDVLDSGVFAVTDGAINYALFHSACNLIFNILALISLKKQHFIIPTIFIGILISVGMRFVSYIILGKVMWITLSLMLRLVMLFLLVLIYRERKSE